MLEDDGIGKYTGGVYATTGTYFPLPWNPAQHTAVPAGTATFQPSDAYHATLTYTISGIGTVTKAVQRQTLAPYVLGGNYSGSMAGSITGCVDPTNNEPQFRGRFTIDSFHPTGQGIEGKMTSALGGGCNAVFHFSAVLNINN